MDFMEIFLYIGKTIFSFIFLLLIMKIMGKRELSKVSTFDLIIFLIISEIFSLSLNDAYSPLIKFIIPVIVIVLLELFTSYISLKSSKIKKFLDGKIEYLVFKGEVKYDVFKKNRYTIDDLMLQLRSKDVQSLEEVEYAILEANGTLNVIKKDQLKILHPEPIINDGEVNIEALTSLNKTLDDLLCDLAKENIKSYNEVFFFQYLIDKTFIVKYK